MQYGTFKPALRKQKNPDSSNWVLHMWITLVNFTPPQGVGGRAGMSGAVICTYYDMDLALLVYSLIDVIRHISIR